MEIGFIKVYCPYDESYRIKHLTMPYTVNWIEVIDNSICWVSEMFSEDGTKRYVGFSRMSEREIDLIIERLNKDYTNMQFKNHRPNK